MQELTNFIKRPNLRSTGLKKEKKSKQKGFVIYSNKIIPENFPNLEMPPGQEA
jgi:hypothetical protein